MFFFGSYVSYLLRRFFFDSGRRVVVVFRFIFRQVFLGDLLQFQKRRFAMFSVLLKWIVITWFSFGEKGISYICLFFIVMLVLSINLYTGGRGGETGAVQVFRRNFSIGGVFTYYFVLAVGVGAFREVRLVRVVVRVIFYL